MYNIGITEAGETALFVGAGRHGSNKDFLHLNLSLYKLTEVAYTLRLYSRYYSQQLAEVRKVNLYWFLTGKGPSGLDPDTVEIEL
jgi:hypothetical protein